jgi:chemotaxis protein MotB
MMGEKDKIPVRVVVKKKKDHGGGSHGGAWKVAYADFVTAMMALFIVLWIVGQSSQVKQMIAEYFKDPVVFDQKVRSGGLLPDSPPMGAPGQVPPPISKEDKREEMKKLEEEAKKLEELIKATPVFDKFKGQVEITVTEEGLRIELVDNSSGLFFDVGSARLKPETVQLLGTIASEIGKLKNQVVVEGYTDSRPYVTPGYSNWELSVDRANSARKILAENGLGKGQIHEVRGFADRKLRRPENPLDYSNRRVSILVPTNSHPAPDAPGGSREGKKK